MEVPAPLTPDGGILVHNKWSLISPGTERMLVEAGGANLLNTARQRPDLVRQVRETHPDMKVIFISGYTEDSFRQRLDADSELHFLPKPFNLTQLASKVKEVISGEAV